MLSQELILAFPGGLCHYTVHIIGQSCWNLRELPQYRAQTLVTQLTSNDVKGLESAEV